MIHVLESRLRGFRRWFSRSEWSLRLLRVPKVAGDHRRGLVLIQIDGLSRTQLEKAIRRGRMPFLRKLLKREGYRLHDVYSGIPSTTAAAQAELFYGVKGAVPAFAYRDREAGRYMKMILPECAARMEERLGGLGRGLCEGGSSYSNMYAGGAAESHFCASGLSPSALWKNANFLGVIGVILWNFPSLVRLVGLLLAEVVVAVYDGVRGAFSRHEFRRELLFIFSRVFVSVGLRELITVEASMDVTRGLPIVHCNFVGYDEQSHRRGPGSKFAHFSLLGIDNCIMRIWSAAHRSFRRDYDVWIYSDHGQESTIPFGKENRRSLEEAVTRVFGSKAAVRRAPRMSSSEHFAGSRAENYLLRRAGTAVPADAPVEPGAPVVIAVGPIGHIYLPGPLEPGSRAGWARRLVTEANIPMVLFADGPGRAVAVTPEGQFELPREAPPILGPLHRFSEECGRDLAAVCHHPHAGDFVVTGWRPRGKPVSFAWENGAHGGPGYDETYAFGMFPANAPLPRVPYLRYAHIREAALHVRGTPSAPREFPRRAAGPRRQLRVMTYNIHGCSGMDGKVSTARIARVLAQYEPDVIALQECYGERTGDQARAIAQELIEAFHYPPTLSVQQDDYGNAILSVPPMRLVKAAPLPTLPGRDIEIRGAMWTLLDVGGVELNFLNTHLGLYALERQRQADALTGPDWLGAEACAGPAILCGDFNAFPSSTAYRTLTSDLHEAQENMKGHKPRNTFFGRHPVFRIDHIFCTPEFRTVKVEVPRTHLTRLASDHLPIVADLGFEAAVPQDEEAAMQAAPEIGAGTGEKSGEESGPEGGQAGGAAGATGKSGPGGRRTASLS